MDISVRSSKDALGEPGRRGARCLMRFNLDGESWLRSSHEEFLLLCRFISSYLDATALFRRAVLNEGADLSR